MWSLTPGFDLADFDGTGEGGLFYFYDQQWKRFFATVPERYLLKINGRPVVFMWHGGFVWYENQNFFRALIDRLRQATKRDFGFEPFVIVEESWRRLDSAALPDGLFDWFEPAAFATLTEFAGIHVVTWCPVYDCSRCDPPGPVILREDGSVFRPPCRRSRRKPTSSSWRGWSNVDENAHLVETTTWGRLYINILKWFSVNVP